MYFTLSFGLLFILFIKIDSLILSTKNTNGLCTLAESNLISSAKKELKSVTCSGADSLSEILKNLPLNVEEVIIKKFYDSRTDKKFNFDEHNFKSLSSIKIEKSYFGNSLILWLNSLKNVKIISFNDSANTFLIDSKDYKSLVIDIDVSGFSKNLEFLKIRNSNISKLIVKNETLQMDLSNNKFMCGNDFIWLLNLYEKYGSSKIYLENTTCFMKKIYISEDRYPLIYRVTGKPMLTIIYYMKEVLINCPDRCKCFFRGFALLYPQIEVECTGLNMTSLPKVLPNDTSACNFTDNLIEDFSIIYSPSYGRVSRMVLTKNKIRSFDTNKLIQKFKANGMSIWLNNNLMEKFPAKEFIKFYEKFDSFRPYIFLGNNPWSCSCDYVSDFQTLTYQYVFDFPDHQLISCAENSNAGGLSLLHVDVVSLCGSHHTLKLHTLDIVIIILTLLLLLLLLDFARNYHQYKKYRKLPFIVTVVKC